MHAYFSISTVFLYLTIGFLGYLCIKAMTKSIPQRKLIGDNVSPKLYYFWLFVILYTFIAVFRKVAPDIGGADAMVYKLNFDSSTSDSRGFIALNNERVLEPGFDYFTRFVRSITSNYRLYFLIIYGIISYSYVKFIRERCSRGLICIPFILLMYPYLRSFNTLRTGLAISLVLIGISMMDKRKWLSLVFLVASVFFHRMSILFVFIWPFYFLLRHFLFNLKKWQYILLSFAGLAIFYFLSILLQDNLSTSMKIDDVDVYWATRSMDENHFERYPLFLGHLLLYGAIIWFYDKIKWNEKSVYLRILFIYDMWVIPAGVVLGAWRFVEYFYIVRLSLWCYLLSGFTEGKRNPDKITIKIVAFLLFASWLVFRLYKEWDPVKISPFIFDFDI